MCALLTGRNNQIKIDCKFAHTRYKNINKIKIQYIYNIQIKNMY